MQSSLLGLLAVVAVALFAGVLVVSHVAGTALRTALAMTRHALRPLRPVGELTSGPRRVQGFLGLASAQSERALLLTSPVSGRPCLGYELELLVAGRRCYVERQALPCVLRDGSGELELPLASAELCLERADSWRGVLETGPPPGLSEALRQKLMAARDAFVARERLAASGEVELAVKTLAIGDVLHVTGEVIQGGHSVSLMGGRPVCVSDRPFSELAKKHALIALGGVALALFVVGVVVAVATTMLGRS